MSPFKALLSEDLNSKIRTKPKDLNFSDLPQGEVLIRSEFSSLNYKDALGVTGTGKIFRNLPMVGGIDVAGVVEESSVSDFIKGQKVLVTGCGLGENQFGGYSEFVRVPAESVIALPDNLNTREAMIFGTAGFTAALCLWRFRKNDQAPDMGPIVVTGASGGVGSFAVSLLHQMGFEVHALSGRKEHYEYLKSLGADQCLNPKDLNLGSRPLESIRYGGVVDNVGGELLAGLCRHVQLWGNVGCIGLAGGAEFHSTVMPHILRGVSLLGISSNNCSLPVRLQIWKHLASDWKPKKLESIVTKTIGLNDVLHTATELLGRKLHGRILVKH